MLARTLPTVLVVRATVRGRKTGEQAIAAPIAAAGTALALVAALAQTGRVPWTSAVLVALLAVRSFALLVFPRPSLRASTLGIIEASAGVVYVFAIAIAWRW